MKKSLLKKEKTESSEQVFKEAKRYYANAKEALKKSPVRFGAYEDSKYVREASAMAYLAALRAFDGYLWSGDKLPASIDECYAALRTIPHNGKLKNALTVVYQNLHILAYYRGGVGEKMVKEGFLRAREIMDMLSP